MGAYKSVVVSAGKGGWGGPLTITPTDDRPYIYSVTGGGIHPVAARIAELTGGTPFDGFKSSVPFDKIAVAVIDCGGTARVGVYPMKKVLTVIFTQQAQLAHLRCSLLQNFLSQV